MPVSVVVFAGPSLTAEDRAAHPGLAFRPPAVCGDIARAVEERPAAVALIDGVFETSPSPWHKEILWGLSLGVAVVGASSMGALRAAELYPFGMRGYGRIFAAYRDGLLDGDDAVAILHGPAETGFLPLTEALVNIRATLEAARERSILGPSEADALLAHAGTLFYKDRTWDALIEAGRRNGLDAGALRRLEAWLPAGRVDLKRRDARELLAALSGALSTRRPGPFAGKRPAFPRTLHWQGLADRLSRESRDETPARPSGWLPSGF